MRFRRDKEPKKCTTALFVQSPETIGRGKGNDGGFYCSEFCADAGETIEPVAASQPPEMASTAGASYDR